VNKKEKEKKLNFRPMNFFSHKTLSWPSLSFFASVKSLEVVPLGTVEEEKKVW
jgi:hypothetical protein